MRNVLFGAVAIATLAFTGAAGACEFIVLYPGSGSATPIGALADDTGRVFLATYGGGKYQRGTVVRLDGDGNAQTLYEFKDKYHQKEKGVKAQPPKLSLVPEL